MKNVTLDFIKKNLEKTVDYMNGSNELNELYTVSENQFIYAIKKINSEHPLKIKIDSLILDYSYLLSHVSAQVFLLSMLKDSNQSYAISNYLRDEIVAYMDEAIIPALIGIKFRDMTDYKKYIANTGKYNISLDKNKSNVIVKQNIVMTLGYITQHILDDAITDVNEIRNLYNFIDIQSTKAHNRHSKTLYF